MRELKCRIYDKDSEKMIYSYEPEEQGKREYYPICFGIGFSHWDRHQLSEIMLFTGLKDKNGKEICEGDVVKSKKNCLYDDGYKIESVYFKDGMFMTSNVPLFIVTDGFAPKIIGNIYENRELLNENI